jgi:hypothetical protein
MVAMPIIPILRRLRQEIVSSLLQSKTPFQKKKKRDTYIGLEVWLQLRKHKALSSNPSLATHPPKKSIKFKNIFISQSY